MTMDVCRICLAGNIKMYSIANTRLKDIYEKLTSNQWSRDRRPVTICYICHSQLNNCFKFWEMSKVSEKIFTQFFACGFEFTEDTVPMLTKRMMQTLSVISVKTLTVGIFSNDETEELKQETPCIEIKAEPGEDSSTPENTEPTENSPHKEDINVPRPKEETIEMNTTEHSPPHKNDTISLDINNIPHFYIVKSETEQSEPLISITEDTKKDCAKNTELYTPEDKKELDNEKSSEKNDLIPKYSQCVTLRFKITNRNVNSKPTMLNDTRKRENPFNFHDKSNGFSSNHGKLNKMPYACNYCDKSFIVKYILEKHMRTHTVEKPYACNFCDRTFNIKSYLKLHMKIHTGVKPYACEQCRKTFHQLKHFKQHLRTHAEEKLHVCKLCNKSFNQISNLQQHMRVHTGEKPYACDECDKRFKQMSNLMQHERVHTGEKPLNNLKQHLRNNAEEKLHVCKLCNKNFNQLSNLQQHMRVHTGEKPYACDECDKRFKQISNLLQHKRVHTGEKPYGCPTCDKKFAQISNLKQHKIIHTGEKPYSCDNCDKTFNQKSNLLQHIKIFQH